MEEALECPEQKQKFKIYIVHPLNPHHYTPNKHRKNFRVLRNLLQPELGVNFSISEGRALSNGDKRNVFDSWFQCKKR